MALAMQNTIGRETASYGTALWFEFLFCNAQKIGLRFREAEEVSTTWEPLTLVPCRMIENSICEASILALQFLRNEAKAGRGAKGRPRAYSDERCAHAQSEFNKLRAEGKDSKGAWSTVAEDQGFRNGDATRAACLRYTKRCRSAN